MNNFYGNGYTLHFMFSLDFNISRHESNKRYRLKNSIQVKFYFPNIKKHPDPAGAYVTLFVNLWASLTAVFKFIYGSLPEGRTVLCGYRRCQITSRPEF